MITFREFFSFKHNRFFWLNLILMVVVIIAVPIIALLWLNSYTRHGEAVVVPYVKGMNIRQAEDKLVQQSLRSTIVDSSYVKGIAPGAVLEQNPVGGTKVKEGRTIYLTINTSSVPQVAIPDIIDNSSMRQAEARLRAIGFKMTEPEFISGEKDWVYGVKYRGQELRTGDKIPYEATLTLCVGNGNEVTPEDSLMMDEVNVSDNDQPIIDESWF